MRKSYFVTINMPELTSWSSGPPESSCGYYFSCPFCLEHVNFEKDTEMVCSLCGCSYHYYSDFKQLRVRIIILPTDLRNALSALLDSSKSNKRL